MSTYKKEVGTAVQNAAGTLSGVVEGQLWYDSTAASFKYQYPAVTTVGSWSTGNNFNSTASSGRGNGTQGTQDASLAVGYFQDTGGTTEFFGGVESYDGTSWTTDTALNTARALINVFGLNTATIAAGGYDGSNLANTESWNGSSWTEVNDLNTGRRSLGGAGTDSTAALAFGGNPAPSNGLTESWNGTSWTEVNDLNSARYSVSGAGTQTSALAVGGYPTVGTTELWDGTSWSSDSSMSTGRDAPGLAGSGTTSGLAFGGYVAPSGTTATEEFTKPSFTVKTITSS